MVASGGLICFMNWARYLYLILWLYGWFSVLLFGFRVVSPFQSFIGMAIGTMDGMLLYALFFSPLRLRFRGRNLSE